MNILIVEDEKHNQRLIKDMIGKLRPKWKITGITDSVSESVDWLKQHTADLIFMDIQLADGLCFSIFEAVKVNTPVVFTTAFDSYAIQAFKVNSIDYLLKPVKANELEAAILKFEHQQNNDKKTSPNYSELLEIIRNGQKKYRTRFMIHGPRNYIKIDVKDIAYFYSTNRITYARLFDSSDHQVDMSLEEIDEQIDPDMFFRANRSIIININAITLFEDYFGGKLVLKTTPPFDDPITISRLKNASFKRWVGK